MPRIRVTTSGLVGAWTVSFLACVPLAYVWGRSASPWGPANEQLYQGAESNEIWVVAPYAVPRFCWLVLAVTAVWLYVGYRHALSKVREKEAARRMDQAPQRATTASSTLKDSSHSAHWALPKT